MYLSLHVVVVTSYLDLPRELYNIILSVNTSEKYYSYLTFHYEMNSFRLSLVQQLIASRWQIRASNKLQNYFIVNSILSFVDFENVFHILSYFDFFKVALL